MQLSMFSLEEPLASPSQSLDFARALLTLGETSCLRLVQSLHGIAPGGWYGRTSPASCRLKEDGILEPSSGCWQNSGMGSPTGFLTLSTSEWNHIDGLSLKDEGVCSLSDILETGDVPRRYFLSAKACRGILRRAEKRGKKLPPQLRTALLSVARGTSG
jgi:hypothetical protein